LHKRVEDNEDLEMTGQVFLLGIITNTEKYSLNPIHGLWVFFTEYRFSRYGFTFGVSQ
jgi:hypothetical protein